jgi:osmotically inducible protein OsmC
MKLGAGSFTGSFSAGSRFKDDPGTNPEELLGAAHAGCFSMAFSHLLSEKGYVVEQIKTEALVTLDKLSDGFTITHITLNTNATVADIDDDVFEELANEAKENCPVSKALGGVEIDLKASLAAGAKT